MHGGCFQLNCQERQSLYWEVNIQTSSHSFELPNRRDEAASSPCVLFPFRLFPNPGSKTRVTVDTASRLLASQETAKEWRKALELVCDLVEKSKQNPTRILPFIDHGRVRFFLKFWGNKYKGSPDWLKAVVRRLDAFTWT